MVKVFDLEVGKTGLNAEDALREGINPAHTTNVWKSRAGYCPEAQTIHVNLTVDKATGRIIGGEVAGTDGAALRMNVIAAAVTARMRIEQVAYLDLGYAPPFSPVWDPVNAAAQKLMREISRSD
jgi:pyruvate/2-oxoglutarate dehydrogenase complex dihydrolipoamide dehydrogenase (E3) component